MPDPIALFPEGVVHYHGDKIRRLFIASAALSLVVVPLWGNILPFGTPAQIGAAILLVLLAGLTNPHGPFWIFCDAAFSAASVFLLESAAIFYFNSDSSVLFMARETEAIVLLFALYYSVKTVRAMLLHKVGAPPTPEEFEDKPEAKHDVTYL